jgi:GR25 family glycosyltransferase involved in LPS biosynthesis
MRCLFINLDAAAHRRARLEANFQALAPNGWTLERIEAAGPDDVRYLAGGLKPNEKGCFVSHRRAIEAAMAEPGDVLILEDDALLVRESFTVLGQFLRQDRQWDLFFPDLQIIDGHQFFWAARQREVLGRAGNYQIDDLRQVRFVGATAYVVREGAKSKLHALLAAPSLDTPYDIALRHLVHTGQLRALYCLPFITSISEDAEHSQIQGEPALQELAMQALRRMFFVGRDVETCAAKIHHLESRTSDPICHLYGGVYAALLQDLSQPR